MKKIKVAMCDDMEPLCLNIKNYFKYCDDLEFVGYCTDSSYCIEMVKNTCPDILLLDIQMETETSGICVLSELLEQVDTIKVIMLTGYSNDNYIFESIINGASDYIVKSCSTEQIVEKIKAVYNGENNLAPEILSQFKQKSMELANAHKSLIYLLNKIVKLSSNELEVLKDVYYGETYAEIAKKRFVEVTTIRSMGSRILRKFGASNMNELIESLRSTRIFELFTDL